MNRKTVAQVNGREFRIDYIDGMMSLNQKGFYFLRRFEDEQEGLEKTIAYLSRRRRGDAS